MSQINTTSEKAYQFKAFVVQKLRKKLENSKRLTEASYATNLVVAEIKTASGTDAGEFFRQASPELLHEFQSQYES